jgi:hypothetical protein
MFLWPCRYVWLRQLLVLLDGRLFIVAAHRRDDADRGADLVGFAVQFQPQMDQPA